MNPFQLIADILNAVAKQLANQSASVIKQAGIGTGKIASRIVEIVSDVLEGKLTIEEAEALINAQYLELKIVVETALGTGEIAAEQIPNDIITAVKDVVFGSIGHLL